MKPTIVEVRRSKNRPAQIEKTALQDKRLSFSAKGLYAVIEMLSEENNGATITIKMLSKIFNEPMADVARYMDELIKFGYVSYEGN